MNKSKSKSKKGLCLFLSRYPAGFFVLIQGERERERKGEGERDSQARLSLLSQVSTYMHYDERERKGERERGERAIEFLSVGSSPQIFMPT
jgi:hypothetical protein